MAQNSFLGIPLTGAEVALVTQSLPGEGLGWARWGSEGSYLGSCPRGAEVLPCPPGVVVQPGEDVDAVGTAADGLHDYTMTGNVLVIVTEKDKWL